MSPVVVMVGPGASLVLMFVVGIDRDVAANREIAPGCRLPLRPLTVLALIEESSSGLGLKVVRVDWCVAF
jgi:hypothetical protein